tara:strand:- start:423418 stop:424863 length:1446 start_codon:yes stop_codon:yes gene_type:complete
MSINFLSNRSILKGVLARRLLVAILFFSSLVTLALTSFQLYLDYNININGLEESIEEIRVSHLDSLGQNLWHLNDDQIILQLLGILEIPNIEYIKVSTPEGDGYQVGKMPETKNIIERRYKISYRQNNETFVLGHLDVTASLVGIYAQLRDRFFIILASQATKTFIVSFFILIIFHQLVGKYLEELVSKISKINIGNLSSETEINKIKESPPDEIDQLLESFNQLQSTLLKDIHKRELVELRLKESQKMEALGTLAGGVAHDFNNILQGIMNCFMLIGTEVNDKSSAAEKVNMGNTLCERGRDLVNQILLYSRADSGHDELINLPPIIDDVVNILRHSFDKNVHYDIEIFYQSGFLKGNATQLRQVIFNLCNNALYAIKNIENPTIRISLESKSIPQGNHYNLATGEYYYLVISDNGFGISQEVQKRIFEPFFTTKEVGKGTGLGLSVVQSIILNHGGHISVNSVEGEGTTFSLLLPITEK